MKQLMTQWGAAIQRDCVKPEYPRPGLVRDSYVNLNGEWECCINRIPYSATYDRTILVPFAPEAPLSGMSQIVQPEDYLHYRRRFSLPKDFNRGRVLLHFGAVDQTCEVVLNGLPVGNHRGGYMAFALDITRALRDGENCLEVHVRDQTEEAPYARGKQKLVRTGRLASIFCSPSSGIWKTVWLESVPKDYITGLRMTPLCGQERLEMMIQTNCPGTAFVRVSLCGERVWQGELPTCEKAEIEMQGYEAWSPDSPTLYDVEIEYGEDRVKSYFGMRNIDIERDAHDIPRFFLNGKPIFFNGVLDQGYWPDGLLTAPSDAALEYDIRAIKALGYNTLRMHVKVEEERFYYLCDKIGMIVWQDMPNGGGDYDMFFVAYLPNVFDWFARGVRDSHYNVFKRADADGREQFREELKDMIEQLYNFPSIVLWTPFNEGWGQFDAQGISAMVRAIDPTRLINEACGWFDQGGGDLHSIHNYFHHLKVKPHPPRTVALTEYGGYACAIEEHVASDKAFGYQSYASRDALTGSYKRLWEEEIIPNVAEGLSAAIYTQFSDTEEEVNGIMTYDRAVVKPEAETVIALNAELQSVFKALTQ